MSEETFVWIFGVLTDLVQYITVRISENITMMLVFFLGIVRNDKHCFTSSNVSQFFISLSGGFPKH